MNSGATQFGIGMGIAIMGILIRRQALETRNRREVAFGTFAMFAGLVLALMPLVLR